MLFSSKMDPMLMTDVIMRRRSALCCGIASCSSSSWLCAPPFLPQYAESLEEDFCGFFLVPPEEEEKLRKAMRESVKQFWSSIPQVCTLWSEAQGSTLEHIFTRQQD